MPRAVLLEKQRLNAMEEKPERVEREIQGVNITFILVEGEYRVEEVMSEKTAMQTAKEIVDNWANNENFEKLEIPKGRLWLLETAIAEAIMKERVKGMSDQSL